MLRRPGRRAERSTGEGELMKRLTVGAVAALILGGLAALATTGVTRGPDRDYVVMYDGPVTQALQSVDAIGGRVIATQKALHLMLVRSSDPDFVRVAFDSPPLKGAVRNQAIGRVAAADRKPDPVELEGRGLGGGNGGVTVRDPGAGGLVEPLADWQWDMRMIGATANGSYAIEQGSRDV